MNHEVVGQFQYYLQLYTFQTAVLLLDDPSVVWIVDDTSVRLDGYKNV